MLPEVQKHANIRSNKVILLFDSSFDVAFIVCGVLVLGSCFVLWFLVSSLI